MRSLPPVTLADLNATEWSRLIAESGKEKISDISSVLNTAVQTAESFGAPTAGALKFLAIIVSFRSTYDSREASYRALFPGAVEPDDLEDADLDLLETMLAGGVGQPDLKARLADLLWCYRRRKNPAHAKAAVSAFIEADTKHVMDDVARPDHKISRLLRAAQIAYSLGEDKPEFIDCIRVIEEQVEVARAESRPRVCTDLQKILLGFEVGNPVLYASVCEEEALKNESKKNYTWAHHYWKLRVGWIARLGDDDAVKNASLRAAECLVLEAEADATRSYGLAKTKLAQAIESLRKAGASAELITELRLKHREYAQRSVAELSPMPGAAKIYQTAAEAVIPEAIEGVKGKCLPEALVWLAGYYLPTDSARHKAEMQEHAQTNPLFLMMGTSYLDSAGRTTAITPGGFQIDEARLRAKMYDMARECQWSIRAMAVNAAIGQIMSELNPRTQDFDFLTSPNPLIEPGRERIFARGLLAGLRGDWMLSCHLLIPQIEHLLRYLLEQHGKITTKIDREGVEQVLTLEKLLRDTPDLEKIIGPDLIFDLRGILVERAGYNLRNRLAHGLIGSGGFANPGAICLWCLVVHLLCCPFFEAALRQRSGELEN